MKLWNERLFVSVNNTSFYRFDANEHRGVEHSTHRRVACVTTALRDSETPIEGLVYPRARVQDAALGFQAHWATAREKRREVRGQLVTRKQPLRDDPAFDSHRVVAVHVIEETAHTVLELGIETLDTERGRKLASALTPELDVATDGGLYHRPALCLGFRSRELLVSNGAMTKLVISTFDVFMPDGD